MDAVVPTKITKEIKMKLSLMIVGVTSLAHDWLNKNWGEVIKLGILAILIITSMQNSLEQNSIQLSTLQKGQLNLTNKVEALQIEVARSGQQMIGIEKSLERHLLQSEK